MTEGQLGLVRLHFFQSRCKDQTQVRIFMYVYFNAIYPYYLFISPSLHVIIHPAQLNIYD